MRRLHARALVLVALGGLVLLGHAEPADAGGGAGTCRGSIEVPGVSLTSATVTATAGVLSASTTTTTGRYALGIDVPAGERASYTIAASAYYPDGYLAFPAQVVTVAAGEVATANFAMTTGIAQAMIGTSRNVLAHVTISWYGGHGSAGYRSMAVNAGLVSIGVPVAAGDVTLWATAFFTTGESEFLGYRSAFVVPGSVTPVSWEVDEPMTLPIGVIASRDDAFDSADRSRPTRR